MPDIENDTNYSLPETQEDQPADNEQNYGLLNTQKVSQHSMTQVPIKRKKSNFNEEIVEIMRSNATFRKEKYEKKAYMNHDEVELFYLSMAKIAKRLPNASEAKLRMEVCNLASRAELAHLSEVNTIQKQLSQNKVLSHPDNMRHYQNQSSLCQPPSSRFVEESNSRSSPSTFSNHSDQSIVTNFSNEEQNFLQPMFDPFQQL